MALVDACRTRSWLFMFHLRLIEECDVEVLVAPSFRCDARVFPPLRRLEELMRHFAVLRRKSSSSIVPAHGLGKELHGQLQGLLDRDVL